LCIEFSSGLFRSTQSWRRGSDSRLLAGFTALAFISLHLITAIQHIRTDEYHRAYLPAVGQLKTLRATRKSIIAGPAMGFDTKFEGFSDDWRLGLYSGLKPDVIVMDRGYRDFLRAYEKDEPAVFTHVLVILTTRYRMTARYGPYWFFERLGPGDPPPAIDLSGINQIRKGRRAEYLFRQLLAAAPVTSEQTSYDPAEL
jgi:hypothetical protein